KYAESRAGLDSIKPVVVFKAITEDDFIQIVYAAMGSMRPDGFVFRLFGNELAVFINADAGAFHNAAAMTAMSRIAATPLLDFHHRFGTNLIRAFKTAN